MIVFAHRWLGMQSLNYLISQGHKIEYVIVSDEMDQNIYEIALSHGIQTYYYHSDIQDFLVENAKSTDWILSFWSPRIISAELLAKFSSSSNVHPSLVPLNQGNDCAAWSIRNDTPAGVSIMTMHSTLDTGDVYAQKQLSWEFPIQGKALHDQLLKLCFDFFVEKWPDMYSGKLLPSPQIGEVTHHTRKQTNQDRKISNLSEIDAETFLRKALAHDFSPKSTLEVKLQNKTYKLTVSLEAIEN